MFKFWAVRSTTNQKLKLSYLPTGINEFNNSFPTGSHFNDEAFENVHCGLIQNHFEIKKNINIDKWFQLASNQSGWGLSVK